MQLKKVLASLLVGVCICANLSIAAYADTSERFPNYGISLTYEIANSPDSILSIENGTAYCFSSTTGSNTASISATHTLQKYWGLWIWNDVKNASWSKRVDGGSICLSNTKSGLDSGTYRVKSVFTLTDKSGKSETITVYSSEQVVS